MVADGATVSAEELLERVWDEHADPFTNVVRMTMMTLRRKLGEPQVIQTVIGVGYRMALMSGATATATSRCAPDDPFRLTRAVRLGLPGHRSRAADDRVRARPSQHRRATPFRAR